jgi:transcriptional regulator with XRE-family HTH domain
MKANHLRAARALLNWDQQTLADRSGLSIGTIRRIERDLDVRSMTTHKLTDAFIQAGLVLYFDDRRGGIGVRLMKGQDQE